MPKSLYFLVLFPFMVISQTPTATQNYVRSKTYKVATTTSIASPTPLQATQSVTYLDGLGRPIQQIDNAQSNTSKDIITHIEYDAFGRQVREYLPFASAQNTMGYSDGTTLKQDQLAQYQTWYGDNNPYSEKLLEASPLNRVLEQAAPGNDWSLTNPTKHTVRFDYQSNTLAGGNFVAKLFKASGTWDSGKGLYEIAMTSNGTTNYPENQLYVTTTKDENWKAGDGKNNTTEEFKDKEGRVVLKRTYDNSIAHDTYYVYDQFGNLTYVIPPKADGSIDTTALNNLCYQYKYDYRNRLVEKKLPGKDWEFIVYDKLDRVVATGPAMTPFTTPIESGWMITKYDAFNRPILTGWLPSTTVTSAGRATLQGLYNATNLPVSETKSASNVINGMASFVTRYTNVAIPTSMATSYHVLTVNYYDDYTTNLFFNPVISFTSSISPNPVFYNDTTNKPKGLPTVTWTRIPELSTGTIKAEMSYTLYDNKGRVVRSFANNYLGGFTQVDSQLEPITGRTNYTVTTHRRNPTGTNSTVITVRDNFAYNAQDRLQTHTHSINGAAAQLLADNIYDELGQLLSKKVGNTISLPLQNVNYSYNIRSWLTGINKVDGSTNPLQQSTDPIDLFAFKINYNNPITNNENNTIQPLYNGNIAETNWLTNTDNVLRRYGYSYDNLNRLKKAVYQKNGGVTNSYNESMSYDKNGNIMTMQRYGDFDDLTTTFQMDNLSYFYDQTNTTNRLMKVTDATNSTLGFKDDSTDTNDANNDYAYDVYGNMTKDDNKGIVSIKYNHLNLPTEILFTGSNKKITYLYNASGVKVQKIVTSGSTTAVATTDYLGGFQYLKPTSSGAIALQYFPHAEGYVSNTVVSGNNTYNYVFNYIDHLGNIRMTYTKFKTELRVLEENHYYPFGLKHSNYNIDQEYYDNCNLDLEGCIIAVPRSPYQYKFSGREWQDELGLNMYDLRARQYDPAIARFVVIDPLTDDDEQLDKSNYAYAWNDPIKYNDPDGECPWCVGAILGAAVELGSQMATNYVNGKDVTDISWGQVGVAAVEGALTSGASVGRTLAVKAGAALASSAIDYANDGNKISSVKDGLNIVKNAAINVAVDKVAGGVSKFALGKVGEKALAKAGDKAILSNNTANKIVKAITGTSNKTASEIAKKVDVVGGSKVVSKAVKEVVNTAGATATKAAASKKVEDVKTSTGF